MIAAARAAAVAAEALVRIVAGERRGMRLLAPRGTTTRPTADRVRESLFAMLGDVSGLELLDPFAGTGALGLEALSRGAAHATFCETAAAALRVLRANVERLGYGERATVRRDDARRRLASDAASGRRYGLLLLDPPYRMLPALQAIFARHAPAVLGPDGLLVLESPASQTPLELGLAIVATRTYGDVRLTLYRHA